LRLEFFYKEGQFSFLYLYFYKKLPFLINIADFVNISIWKGKKRRISANVIDHMFMFMLIEVKIFDIAMCLVVICTIC